MSKKSRIKKSLILMSCLFLLLFTACGEKTQPENKEVKDEVAATGSSLTVAKDGRISSTIVEDFMGSNYSEDRLKEMIETSMDDYRTENQAAEIKLKSCKVKDGVANVQMEYGDYQAYAGFNNENFFVGTIRDANMAGYDLDVTLRSVSDGTTVSKPELLGMGDSHIVIFASEEETDAGQLRVNCSDEILYTGDGVSAAGKKSADVSLAKGYQIIVYK